MPDIIQLLPDNIANQIAAGEVIQRPASAVKELLENAVDAGATEVRLIIADAGKQLIQVIDNGNGMSGTDARMAFERHATSKIRGIEDLFRIRTMGFRGEALASIAAVSQVELKTKRPSDETGVYIEIENSIVLKQEPCACPSGTSISMKNLFFSVPARRNFLKSNAAELRHIVDEFVRVVMAFPGVFFSMTSNGQEMFHLDPGTSKQRIVQLFGNSYNAKLVSVKEETDYLNITGFVGKPETAKKTRGDQYFFVNNRFIKSPYLNHAVASAFEHMIPKDSFPSYALFIDLDPAQVDINVHPTKQEIKFEDEKIMYAFVQAAVKHALAQFSIAPSLDFTLNPEIQQLDAVSKPFSSEQRQEASASPLFNTFSQKHQAHLIDPGTRSNLQHWKQLYEPDEAADASTVPLHTEPAAVDTIFFQLHQTFIVVPEGGGFRLVHQQLAHERILYEKFSGAVNGQQVATQKSLFPVTLDLSMADFALLHDLLPDLTLIGYELEPFGQHTFIIRGVPSDTEAGNERHSIELLLEQFKHFSGDLKLGSREKMLRFMARQQAIKAGQALGQAEMRALVSGLFQCAAPNVTPAGHPTYLEFREDQLDKLFGRMNG